VLGRHDGAVGFTVGQRRGLSVAGGVPVYVTATRPRDGVVVVGPREDPLVNRVVADDVVWRGGTAPRRVTARARYRAPGSPATARVEGTDLIVEFDAPVEAVAPGQALVCWEGTRVLGGGRVRESK
jgi:tRNA-specific 2-thiouridylase